MIIIFKIIYFTIKNMEHKNIEQKNMEHKNIEQINMKQINMKQTLIAEKDKYIKKIDAIRAYECTDMMLGYDDAVDILKKSTIINKQIFLFTDGQVNRGTKKMHLIIEEIIKAKKENGICTNSFGLGTNYNEELLRTIAQESNGQYCYISDSEIIL